MSPAATRDQPPTPTTTVDTTRMRLYETKQPTRNTSVITQGRRCFVQRNADPTGARQPKCRLANTHTSSARNTNGRAMANRPTSRPSEGKPSYHSAAALEGKPL